MSLVGVNDFNALRCMFNGFVVRLFLLMCRVSNRNVVSGYCLMV